MAIPMRISVLDHGHADLGTGGDPDADHREDEHHEDDDAGDGHRGPGARRRGTGNRQDRRAEDDHPGDGADNVGDDHQPPGEEPEVRVDRPADPLERRAAIGAPQVQPAVRVRDDQHGDRRDQQNGAAAVSRRRREQGERNRDRGGRGGRGHADHRGLGDPDRIGLQQILPVHDRLRGRLDARTLTSHQCSLPASALSEYFLRSNIGSSCKQARLIRVPGRHIITK